MGKNRERTGSDARYEDYIERFGIGVDDPRPERQWYNVAVVDHLNDSTQSSVSVSVYGFRLGSRLGSRKR
jgi:hypothetical protein